jgi:hypothetical protein
MSHETDFYSWTQEQAALLRQGRLGELDIINLVEEVEDMGRSERRELESRLVVLLAHLLKWQYHPSHRGSSWESTIRGQRFEILKVLKENPGLKRVAHECFDWSYKRARFDAMGETRLKLSVFPTDCPWTLNQVLDDNFWLE